MSTPAKKSSLGIFLAVAAVAVVAVLAVVFSRSRQPAQPPAAPQSAAELTQNLIEERMADPAYTNGLAKLAARQQELASLRYSVASELAAWREGFLASNETARAVSEKIKALAAEGEAAAGEAIAALQKELDGLFSADPQGKSLLGKLGAVEEAIKRNQEIAHDFIGARVREQAKAHAAEERAINAKGVIPAVAAPAATQPAPAQSAPNP